MTFWLISVYNLHALQISLVGYPTIAGQTYQLEYTDDLSTGTWTPLGTPFAGIDGIVAVTNSMSVTPNCFFRMEVLEVQ